MRDPYDILGVRRGTDKAEVKRAYRELAKQYHPDQHINNPLSNLAEEKFREIQEAYDLIMKDIDYSRYSNTREEQVRNQNNGYESRMYKYNSNSSRMCDLCLKLYCADCCCECCGADLISCC